MSTKIVVVFSNLSTSSIPFRISLFSLKALTCFLPAPQESNGVSNLAAIRMSVGVPFFWCWQHVLRFQIFYFSRGSRPIGAGIRSIMFFKRQYSTAHLKFLIQEISLTRFLSSPRTKVTRSREWDTRVQPGRRICRARCASSNAELQRRWSTLCLCLTYSVSDPPRV